MSATVEKIINAARECFFQHGFNASNVSLICRYANISRATIYKSFKSKEDVFRALVKTHIEEKHAFLAQYTLSKGDFWADTQQLILERCQGIFDDIPNNAIRSELVNAGQSLCKDIVIAEKQALRACIETRLKTEVREKRVCLTPVNLTINEFALLIETLPFGLVLASVEENSMALIKQVFNVLKASTTPHH